MRPVANGPRTTDLWRRGLQPDGAHSLPILPIYNIRRFSDFVTELLQFPDENDRIILSDMEKKYSPKFSSGAFNAHGEAFGEGLGASVGCAKPRRSFCP